MPEIQLVDVWQVTSIQDDRGGRGEIVGYFYSRDTAEEAARGKGWFGPGDISPKMAIRLPDGKCYILAEPEPVELNVDRVARRAAIKAAGLAKLTAEEKAVLGLK